MPETPTGKQVLASHKAEQLQAIGDGLTAFREKAAPFLGMAAAVRDESWLVTAVNAGTQLTDMFDGKAVRAATELRGYKLETGGSEADPRADRKLIHNVLGGLAIRFARNKDPIAALVAGSNLGISLWRNRNMIANREAVKNNGLPKKELDANVANKVKMWGQSAGIDILLSPAAQRRSVRRAGFALLTVGTLSGVAGERIFRRKVNRLIEEKHRAEDRLPVA